MAKSKNDMKIENNTRELLSLLENVTLQIEDVRFIQDEINKRFNGSTVPYMVMESFRSLARRSFQRIVENEDVILFETIDELLVGHDFAKRSIQKENAKRKASGRTPLVLGTKASTAPPPIPYEAYAHRRSKTAPTTAQPLIKDQRKESAKPNKSEQRTRIQLELLNEKIEVLSARHMLLENELKFSLIQNSARIINGVKYEIKQVEAAIHKAVKEAVGLNEKLNSSS